MEDKYIGFVLVNAKETNELAGCFYDEYGSWMVSEFHELPYSYAAHTLNILDEIADVERRTGRKLNVSLCSPDFNAFIKTLIICQVTSSSPVASVTASSPAISGSPTSAPETNSERQHACTSSTTHGAAM